MRIAFCTTCKGRLDHLRQTLPRNLAENADYEDAVFVVLDYSCQDDVSSYLRRRHAGDIDSGRLVVYRHSNGGKPFHVAHAKNMAARCGIAERAEILVTVDADNFLGRGFATFVAASFQERVRPGMFLCPDYALIKSLPHGALRPVRGYAGRLAVRAQDFIKLGGYDEVLDTWRGEDIDINFRLQRMGYAMRFIDNRFLHAIGHNAEVRFREYPHAQKYEDKGEIDVIRARTDTVVNAGRVGLGAVHRNFSGDPGAVFNPLPTRIFGVGLHKTATSSLHAAFLKLGLDSFHWGTGEAPMIWAEMHALKRSPTLEQFYALSDLPIPLLYRELDAAYPGSKFVLTVRDEVAWLGSVQRLWSHAHNPTRKLWDVYPFSNTVHEALYGRRDFDALTFLARYRRHNDEVREYFRDRPGDLLEMRMDGGGSWEELCAFLGLPVPEGAYPRENISRTLFWDAVTT